MVGRQLEKSFQTEDCAARLSFTSCCNNQTTTDIAVGRIAIIKERSKSIQVQLQKLAGKGGAQKNKSR